MRFEIKIKRRSQPEWLLWVLIMLPFLSAGLTQLLHLPDGIKYIMDVSYMGLLILMCIFRNRLPLRRVSAFLVWTIMFLLFTLIVYIPQYQSVFYYLWGLRNNFRFFVAFTAFAVFINIRSANETWQIFDKLFWINAIISVFQFIVLSERGDHTGGIFGTETGCNQYTNIFLVIMLTKELLTYLNSRERITKLLGIGIASLMIAAMAELKFFFVELIIIIGLSVLITDFSWKKLWIVLGGSVGIMVGAVMLSVFFTANSRGWLNLNNVLAIATSERGYTSSGDLNRLTAISQISHQIFDNWGQRLFGFGLGNCDTSSFAICNTPFFQRYSYLHYNWFSAPMLFLETGYIGLVMYFIFFGMVFFLSRKRMAEGTGNRMYCQMAMIMSLVCCVIAFYNSSLRIESAYMVYFVLALPFIGGEGQEKTESMPQRRQLGRARYSGERPVSH